MCKKWVLINGACGGIGTAVTMHFIKKGYSIILLGRDKTKLTSLKNQCEKAADVSGQIILYFTFDLTSREKIDQIITQLQTQHIIPSVFVNCAGIVKRGGLYDVSMADWLEVINITVLGIIALVTEVTNLMRENSVKGSVVLINGMLAKHPDSSLLINSVTTSAMENFVKAAAKELGKYGIRINAVNPGVTMTPLFKSAVQEISRRSNIDETRIMANAANRTALGKIAEPSEIANAVGFLSLDDASHITGSSLAIDGGVLV